MDRMYHVLKRKHNTIGLLGVNARGICWVTRFPSLVCSCMWRTYDSRVLEGWNARFGANIPRTRN